MAAPNVLGSLQEIIKQGPILREFQRGMTDLCSRVGDLERKRGRSSSCDRNPSDRDIINKKRKLLQNVENESESDADSDIEVSNKETHHIPDTQQPSTSKELDNILSDGELASEDESDPSDRDIINKKRKLLQNVENESESDADSDIEVSNKETHHIPDTQQPSTSKELDNILSDGELASEDESDDDILKELKLVFKGTEKSGPAIDKGLADVVNEGLRSVGQSEEVKKLREKFIRPSNVDNLQVPKVEPIIWRNLSDKGKATDAAVQKAMSKFMPGLTAIVQQLELINKHKKELKKIPVFKEIKKLSTEAVSALSHAVSASCQQRKDAIKSELDSKFHSLCEPAHPVSATQLFGDNLNAELKELDDSKKVHVSIAKKRGFFKPERKNRYDKKYSSQEDFRRGFSKNHKPFQGKRLNQQAPRKDFKGKWSQRRQ